MIFPTQLNFNFGNRFFQASSNFTASLLASVNNNSKSSPSVSAAIMAGLARNLPSPRNFAAREIGNRRFQKFRADVARVQNVTQIARQSVAQIHHRVNGKMFHQPARFGHSRLKIQMFSRQRTAQFARHKNRVADFRAATQNLFSARQRFRAVQSKSRCVRDSSSFRRRQSPRNIFPPARSGHRKFWR